ncbi:MAG: hypothetical protein QOK07_321, partial [Gemmatimonadaceae bacterium]|nr:hypothetical protein [Gemmatimonadaceae bacterium]
SRDSARSDRNRGREHRFDRRFGRGACRRIGSPAGPAIAISPVSGSAVAGTIAGRGFYSSARKSCSSERRGIECCTSEPTTAFRTTSAFRTAGRSARKRLIPSSRGFSRRTSAHLATRAQTRNRKGNPARRNPGLGPRRPHRQARHRERKGDERRCGTIGRG